MQFGCLCHSLLAVWLGQSWDASCLLYYTASVVGSELGHMSALLYSAVRSELGYIMSARLYSQCSRVRVGIRHICHITQQWSLLQVYGWGDSQYGQVGVGTRHVYHRPMLLEALLPHSCVAVHCGQYHSLAITSDCK